MATAHVCPKCRGTGKQGGADCEVCDGKKVVFQEDAQEAAQTVPSEDTLDLSSDARDL